MKDSHADVLIVGGGVIGTSIAWHLATRGAGVTLLEAGDLASGSSGACDGLIFMQSKKPGVHLQLAMESRERFSYLQNELPVDIEYHSSGGMVVIETDAEMEAMQSFVDAQREIGLDVSLLETGDALKLEPCLSPEIRGVSRSPLDGQVNPIRLTHGFALGARKYGARIITGAKVTSLDIRGGCISELYTSKGRFMGDVVIIAAGARTPDVCRLADVNIPIKPRRGQIAVSEACPPQLAHCLISAKYIAAKFNPELARGGGGGISVEQTRNGNFLLGSTREFAGFDNCITLEGLQTITRKTTLILPCLERINIIRAFAGFRPWTPDGLPVLGPVRGLDNLFIAAGHEGDGIALSPVTGELMAEMILDGHAHVSLDDFSLDRFPESDATRR